MSRRGDRNLPQKHGCVAALLASNLPDRSRPSSWWRFETEAEAAGVQRRWWKSSVVGDAVGGAIDGMADCAAAGVTAVKPCAFGAPLRGFGA
jgi:hypothetical protein